MPSDLEEARRDRDRLEERLAELVAERDELTEVRKDKAERDPKTEQREHELDRDIAELTRQIKRKRKQIGNTRERFEDAEKEVKEERREQREERRSAPKIIDLGLSFRSGMATQTTHERVIGHHTAGPDDTSLEDAIRLCKLYHGQHQAQGWAGEGYHLCIARTGEIILLRPTGYVGAHTLNNNTGSIGLMCHGTTGDHPTEAQQRTVRWIAENAHTKKMPASHRASRKLTDLRWYGHRDLNPTACPGDHYKLFTSKGVTR